MVLVNFSDSQVTFDHLAGPFAKCHETFDLQPSADGLGTCLVHSGTYRLRGGLWTALLALGPVKMAFEAPVREHMQDIAHTLR